MTLAKAEDIIDDALASPAVPGAGGGGVMAKPRTEVQRFAELMESKLRENTHKGGWDHEGPGYFSKRIGDEMRELRSVLDEYRVAHRARPSAVTDDLRRRIGREAADVANFAMMIADVCGALDTVPGDGEAR